MVGEIKAMFWASNSSGPRASFLSALTGDIGGAVIAAILQIRCRWLRRLRIAVLRGVLFLNSDFSLSLSVMLFTQTMD
jgi:hypothetical protein